MYTENVYIHIQAALQIHPLESFALTKIRKLFIFYVNRLQERYDLEHYGVCQRAM